MKKGRSKIKILNILKLINIFSPFTFWDFLQQRRRWLQGIYLTVHSRFIPIRCKILLASSLYAWVTMPLTTLQVNCPIITLTIKIFLFRSFSAPFFRFLAHLFSIFLWSLWGQSIYTCIFSV